MNNLFKMFATDKQVEQEGVWLNFGPCSDVPGSPDTKIKIARAGGANTQFEKRREQLLKPYRHQIQHDIWPEEVAQQVQRQLYAEMIVLGWENVFDEDSTPMECNAVNAERLFEKLPELFNVVRSNATQAGLFRQHLREEDVKN
jgi:hypothetical protein